MNSQNQDRKPTTTESTVARSRFNIEKLEERIAPAKGGIPGTPEDHGGNPHDDDCRFLTRGC